MKKYHLKYALLAVILSFVISLSSCQDQCTLPDKVEYRYGLLDSMPEGTQVVFESNTGKLDTATYGPIVRKVERIDNGRSRCESQYTNIHYEEQELNFSNKFNLKSLKFKRWSGNDDNDDPKLILMLPFIDSIPEINVRYRMNSFVNSYQGFTDTYQNNLFKGNVIYGSFIYSKTSGFVKIAYYNSSNTDTVYTFKNIIVK